MAVNFLLDTNVAIDYIGGAFSAKASAFLDNIVENETAISVINQIEMLGFNPDDPRDLHPFEELVATQVLPLDETVVNRCISLRKAHKIKLPDAIVAATALVHNLSLLTRNESDFRKIPDLKLINPHNLV